MTNNKAYYGTIYYTFAGFLLGIIMIVFGVVINYNSGFIGPWFKIFNYSPDFVLIVFSPIYLSLLFCFIGYKREQLVLFNRTIKYDLSQEKEINSASDQQIQLLAKVMAQVNESIVITNLQGKIEWINTGFTNTHGYKLAEVKDQELSSILHGPLTDKNVAANMIKKLLNGEAVSEELLTYHKNGNTIWLSLSIKPIFDDSGNILHFIAIQNNISNRKEKELSIEALYKELADYKFALDEASIVIKFNREGKLTYVNSKFCELNELTEEYILGKDYRTFSVSLRDKAVVAPLWNALLNGKTWKGELVNRTNKGKTYWTDTTIVPLKGREGQSIQYLAIQKDITVRKKLESQVLVNKVKLQTAMQIAKLGSWDIDEKGNLSMSEELRKIYEFPETGTVTLDDVYKNIPKDDLKLLLAKMELIANNHITPEFEYRYLINGKTHYMVSNHTIQYDEDGKNIGSFGTVQDITTTKLIALALKKSEEEKAVILNHTQTLICVHDLNGVLMDINPAAEKIIGFTKAEIIGLNLRLIISPEHYGDFDNYITTINNNKIASGKMDVITKSGKKMVWLYRNAVYENNGNIPYVIASAIDITESVKARYELERQQQFIRQIIDNSPNLIFLMNEEKQIILYNKTFINYYPFNELEIPLAESLYKGEDDIFLNDISNLLLLNAGDVRLSEGSLINPANNKPSWFTIIVKIFKEANGKKYLLCFGMDMTKQHQIEVDLLSAKILVEKSLKVKDEFISNMSHEIRTPLNAVIGFTDLLAETILNTEQAGYVDIVQVASGNLLSLINNILDLSKIEAHNLALESLPMSIPKIVQDVVTILAPKAKSKGIIINTIFNEKLSGKVLGDQLRLTQVMLNLLGNAIKFTDTGTIDIDCAVSCGPDVTMDYVSFAIKDTGIGIPLDKQDAIFQRFIQASTNTERLYGGTGLGLNITKSIIELFGSTISMESVPGVGTAFNFTLPFKKYIEPVEIKVFENQNKTDAAKNDLPKPVHILLAEDNMINAMLATKVLNKKGFTVVHVVNGELVLQALKEQEFDLILMDIQMPVLNGINTSKAIRALSGPIGQIPIIAMTAYSLHGEMQDCYNIGMNGYVSKPFKATDLYNTIMEVYNNSKKITLI